MTVDLLDRPTLVLNRNWQPVGIATVSRTLVKLWNGNARVVDPNDYQIYTWSDWSTLKPNDDEPFIQTTSLRLRVPEVITLTKYDRVPNRSVAFSRRNLFKRDKFTCQYCLTRPGSEELTIDHVTPRSHGGETTWENCVVACVDCNSRKANRTPSQAHMPLKESPAQPRWKPFYASIGIRIDSWSKFVSEVYWNVELES
ncbi:MAG: HNH endonuclease [Planctomycetota bacterium]|nr:HNH endonuclease [Planctomycetota bacterium]MDA1162867.1 HNH endonuclease [Planctomycetota bacterium]